MRKWCCCACSGFLGERMQLKCSRVSNIKVECKMYIQNKQEELWGVNREGKRRKMYMLVFSSVNIPTNKTSAWFDLILAHTVRFPISLNCSFYQSITFTEHKLLVTNQLNLCTNIGKEKTGFHILLPNTTLNKFNQSGVGFLCTGKTSICCDSCINKPWGKKSQRQTKVTEQSLKINNFSF